MKSVCLILILILIFVSSHVFAADGPMLSCINSASTKDLKKAGRIVYEIGSEKCLLNEKSSECIRHIEKDTDYCENPQTVVKVSCENGVPISTPNACPAESHCEAGACN